MSCALDALGDKWSLLIVRDILLRGKRTHGAFRQSSERIATNILADRLDYLEREGIVRKRPDPDDGRSELYSLTRKGADLLPLLLAMTEWSGKYDMTLNSSKRMREQKEALVKEMRRMLRQLVAMQQGDEIEGPTSMS
ncbi:winged helix-turn-helix transcriptional regulator [Mesorhizobium sp. B1-1-8]|uniref:winged helix-turn-helix transcriptional regulator n=1 Tax=Mesorhizobium sp. B1-1-8 TaxID=2589976 RepID=UPI0015E43F66|nr:helix-turn-helix domain-containing protein [Mesorhizobium sp. B1-1-8]UCI07917.1 helix-turn-helix transcriptional regulator [Mesorhizobium sp. B1-1-8]